MTGLGNSEDSSTAYCLLPPYHERNHFMNQCEYYCRVIKRLCNYGGILPPEYQQVEWIQGVSGQYIDTGIVPNYYTGIEASGIFSGKGDEYFTEIGCRYSLNGTGYTVQGTGEGQLRLAYGTSNLNWLGIAQCVKFSFIPGADLKFRYELSDGTTGSKNINSASFNPQLNHNINIMALNNNGTASSGGKCLIKYFKMYSSTTLTRDYIPCYRKSDNKTGMYDLVTSAFYPNLGAGEFTVGNNV